MRAHFRDEGLVIDGFAQHRTDGFVGRHIEGGDVNLRRMLAGH